MSLVSNGSLNENTTPYIGICFEIGVAAELRIELGRALERIGEVAEEFAHRRRAGRKRARARDGDRIRRGR